jgi:hypothetical protein
VNPMAILVFMGHPLSRGIFLTPFAPALCLIEQPTHTSVVDSHPARAGRHPRTYQRKEGE